MSFFRRRFLFCTLGGGILRFITCFKRFEPANLARSMAACFMFFPCKTSDANPTPLFKACFPIAFAPLLIKGITVFQIALKIPDSPP